MKKLLLVGVVILQQSFAHGQEFVKENLGTKINTQYPDTKPLISPDGKTLYFARQFYPENIKGERDAQDIYFSIYTDGEWSKAANIGQPLNDAYPNGVSSISPDGNSLLVLNAYDETSVKNGASVAFRDGNIWTQPRKVDIRNFYNNSAYADYYLSNNEQEMLMAIEREDTFGDQDLYISFRMADNHWTEPVNLGPIVNSTMAEFAPFLAADNKTLFFASEGHGSYGSSDIFYSKRLDDTWQNWTEPINIGTEVNTPKFEGYYTIPVTGDYAYFVSSHDGIDESKDIFRVEIPYQFRPEPVLLIAGHVINGKTRGPLEASILYHSIDSEAEKGEAISNNDDGAFKIVLPHGYQYHYYAEAAGFFGIALTADEVKTNRFHQIENNLYMVPLELGNIIPLFDVQFNKGGTKIQKESAFTLQRVLKMLKADSTLNIKITCFTNDMPGGQENLELSVARAESVRYYLENNDIAAGRLQVEGLGSTQFLSEEQHVYLNKSVTNSNNRIELTIIGVGGNMLEQPQSKAEVSAASEND